MPRLETTTRELFKFEELTDKAKDKAREWWRESARHDEWWEHTYEDAVTCAGILGIEIASKSQNWVNTSTGKRGTHTSPAIFFSGFWSQGDGACFEGSYAFKAGAAKAIREHTGDSDPKLNAIADALATLPCAECWSANITTDSRYSHSGAMTVDSEWCGPIANAAGDEITELPDNDFADGEQTIKQAMRAFADWIYRSLEKAYEWQNADEQVDENICANEYEFTAAGEIA